ncbi:peptidoglycan-binding protein [Actinoplanes sp. L3-i22]|uniref:peptidoglycan-binding domain-containing protein n=1 Tax=Actinoplanes sp. L3-i22 TaxID=2836373 RepID=UPI001C799F9D|nr:peptidoglycan-binding protein [Actinoplanes sp. L3-i22]BCY10101.1 hypothetical protein L3i22_051890 [Actinoplanes sp. L3-i22]
MRIRRFVPLIVVALVVAGCGEQRLTKKQEAVAEAQADLAAQVQAFCGSGASYVTALDRYGDLITATAPTVGDVKAAGAELAGPRDDVLAAADGITSAREALAEAEKELAAAQVKASVSPSVTTSASPLVPATTVSRVKQADADFAAAQQGVTDQTPLRQASERFNAAAVALEMSWLRLLADAGCVSEDQHRQARDYTLAVQKSLAEAGYYENEVDGVYGPSTVAAVQAVQKAHGLSQTGTVDKATDAALRADLQAKGGAAIASTAAVQQTLKLAGFWSGPVDGAWTDELTAALKAFQSSLGVEPTGAVDAATVAAVEHAREQPAPSASR